MSVPRSQFLGVIPEMISRQRDSIAWVLWSNPGLEKRSATCCKNPGLCLENREHAACIVLSSRKRVEGLLRVCCRELGWCEKNRRHLACAAVVEQGYGEGAAARAAGFSAKRFQNRRHLACVAVVVQAQQAEVAEGLARGDGVEVEL